MNKPRIVIVGGGAGGIELATKIGKKLGRRNKAEIILVDANPTHLWKPRLHEVAAGVINASFDELSYAAHGQLNGFKFILGRMISVDRETKNIRLSAHFDGDVEVMGERDMSYDSLVLSLGSQTNDFGTKGAQDHCIFLDQRKAAEAFHQSFLNVYLRASQAKKANDDTHFSIAIVGAGATGVELAAELEHTANALTHYGFDGIDPKNVTITIIEASDRVMPALTTKASSAIHRQLEKLDIQVLTGELVVEVTDKSLITKSGKVIDAALKVWSAGIKAPALLADIEGLESNRINQLVVLPTLQTSADESIFAIGDCAQCPQPGADRPVPPRAQAASQQAALLAKSFIGQCSGKSLLTFKYRDKGSLISLSKKGSVGQIMGNLSGDFTFEGKIARLFYVTLYRLHQIALHGYVKTMLLVFRDKLNKQTGPTLKLH